MKKSSRNLQKLKYDFSQPDIQKKCEFHHYVTKIIPLFQKINYLSV